MTSTTATPQLITTGQQARSAINRAKAAGNTIGLVPTMGALHEGHLSLVRASTSECGFTAVTIFVNSSQFGPHEDFRQYPRTLQKDLESLGHCGVDLVFAPDDQEIYPTGFSTAVDPPQVAESLEGQFRPGHFRGVATVVLKLFQLMPADIAFFGQKDYQQSLVIKAMVKDLNLPIKIRVCPIVRESDGLAMSSRNVNLTADQRLQASALSSALDRAAEMIGQGQRNADMVRVAMQQILSEAGIDRVDYAALVDPETLADIQQVAGPSVALIAAHVGQTRLIDNQLIACQIAD